MSLRDDFNEEQSTGSTLVYMTMGGVFFVFAILAIVLWFNKEPARSKDVAETMQTEKSTVEPAQMQYEKKIEEKSIDELISGSKLTSDQLDIWGEMPPVNVMDNKQTEMAETQEKEIKKEEPVLKEEDLSKGGTKTMIINNKGAEEWVTINPYLSKHKYEYTNLVYKDPMMEYYENSKKISNVGIDISKEQGFVDYNRLKKQGISFAMIRCASRGYGSGKLILDDYFLDNIKGATDAGMEVGIIFYSQAINEEEAVAEARLALECVGENNITYPISFVMEKIENDVARTDKLTKKERTKIASTFLAVIKQEGFKPILSGTKEWLIAEVDLMQLTDYDVWLLQEKDIPDYPYRFGMWQYTTNGKLEGIEGKANLNISFIDYRLK